MRDLDATFRVRSRRSVFTLTRAGRDGPRTQERHLIAQSSVSLCRRRGVGPCVSHSVALRDLRHCLTLSDRRIAASSMTLTPLVLPEGRAYEEAHHSRYRSAHLATWLAVPAGFTTLTDDNRAEVETPDPRYFKVRLGPSKEILIPRG